jgi:hypothetical protein
MLHSEERAFNGLIVPNQTGPRTTTPEPGMGGSPANRNVWSAALSQAKSEDGGLVCANVSGL